MFTAREPEGFSASPLSSSVFISLKSYRRMLADGKNPAELLDSMAHEIVSKGEADRENGRIDRKN